MQSSQIHFICIHVKVVRDELSDDRETVFFMILRDAPKHFVISRRPCFQDYTFVCYVFIIDVFLFVNFTTSSSLSYINLKQFGMLHTSICLLLAPPNTHYFFKHHAKFIVCTLLKNVSLCPVSLCPVFFLFRFIAFKNPSPSPSISPNKGS